MIAFLSLKVTLLKYQTLFPYGAENIMTGQLLNFTR